MKKIIAFTLFMSFSAMANLDPEDMKGTEATAAEIESSRACFRELESNGCRHPREDLEQFKSCMNNVLSALSPSCQKMMTELYKK